MTDSQPTATPIAEGIVARAARALGYVVTGDAGGCCGACSDDSIECVSYRIVA